MIPSAHKVTLRPAGPQHSKRGMKTLRQVWGLGARHLRNTVSKSPGPGPETSRQSQQFPWALANRVAFRVLGS